jgi:molybdopterin converting factor small subunit
MLITVQYLGQLGHLADRSEESREAPEEQLLTALLHDVAAQYGEDFQSIVFDDAGHLRPSLMVLVNDAPVDKADPPTLRDGDQITLLAAISGG